MKLIGNVFNGYVILRQQLIQNQTEQTIGME
jgi:hypothetical protein